MFVTSLALLAFTSIQAPASPPVAQPSPEYVSWTGFKYLPPDNRRVDTYFPAATPGFESVPVPPAVGATPWRLKIFLLKRVDRVERLADGTLYEEKCSMEKPDLDRITRAVSALAQDVQILSKGKLQLVPLVTSEDETLLFNGRSLKTAVHDYTYPRANGGKFETDDHRIRGPYESVICIHPVPSADQIEDTVNGMPLASFSVYGFFGYESRDKLLEVLKSHLAVAIAKKARQSGLFGSSSSENLESAIAKVSDGNWPAVLTGSDLPAPELNSRMAQSHSVSSPSPVTPDPIPASYKGLTCDVKLATDSEKGSVLGYMERGEARNGGLCFPSGSKIEVTKTPTLNLWIKSNSHDPLELEFSSSGKSPARVCLGEDLPGTSDITKASFQRDGSWHLVKLDLKATGLASIDQIRLMPTPNSLQHPKITLGPIEMDFASVEATADPADPPLPELAPAADSPDNWARAKWAHSSKPSPQLLSLLKDADWTVRLNALQAYIAAPDPLAESALTENATIAIDGPVSAAACRALWNLATVSARLVVHQVIKTGVTEQSKAECALILGETKDSTFAPELITLQQSRALATRIVAVDALGQMKGENADIIRLSFIYEDEPALKLEVTRTCNPSDPYQYKKLLWSCVNEGSEAVRLESYEELLQSPDPTARAGGAAGVKDDSVPVRIELLDFMAAHPEEANRDAIRLAVIDRSARVKAAAIRAFATLPKGLKMEELGEALKDAHPEIEIELLRLAKTGKITLPDDVIKQMRETSDPDVLILVKSINS